MAQYRSFLSHVNKPRDELIFRLMGECGLRVGEVIGGKYKGQWTVANGEERSNETELPGLRRMDRLPDARIRIRGKGTKDRVLFTTKRIEELLDAMEPLGGSQDRYVSIVYTQVRNIIAAVLKREDGDLLAAHGSEAPPEDRMSPHWFRHTFAVNYLEYGGDVTILKDLMGHSDLNTTMQYRRIVDRLARRDVEMVHRAWERA